MYMYIYIYMTYIYKQVIQRYVALTSLRNSNAIL